MSTATTSGTAFFADLAGRRRKFCLRLGEIEDLERLCQAGIGGIMVRIAQHAFYARDVWETIRLGLEGGGTSEAEATAVTMRLQSRPVAEHLELAARILEAAVAGVPDEAGNGEAAGNESPETLPLSSAPEPLSADPLTMSGA